MTSILLADDDIELCDLLTEYLKTEGFNITAVYNGPDAINKTQQKRFDIIILDVMLPGLTGFEVLRELRQQIKTPILMLTARGADIDRIIGLEMGADDYLPKPCNPRELVARIRAILRRTTQTTTNVHESENLQVADVTLHLAQHQVLLDTQEIILTSTEFTILAELLRHAGNVVSKDDLTEKSLGRKLTAYDRSMDMHVSNLRKKLGTYANGKARIKTIRGVGYQYLLP